MYEIRLNLLSWMFLMKTGMFIKTKQKTKMCDCEGATVEYWQALPFLAWLYTHSPIKERHPHTMNCFYKYFKQNIS